MQEELKAAIKAASKKLFGSNIEPELSRPEEKFGDFSTNVAMQLAAQVGKKPAEIAAALVETIDSKVLDGQPTIAGPGFINFRLSDRALTKLMSASPIQKLSGQKVVVEYSDPNPFKVLHVGHLYTSIVGDSIARLLEAVGANVHRVNFGGDVGLHVAKTIYTIIQKLGGEKPGELAEVVKNQRAQWLADRYVEGNDLYKKDEAAKTEIKKLNQKIYQIHQQKDKTSPLAQIYWTTRSWSYDYFDEFYKRIGSGFEKYYPESETVEPGLAAVKANMGKVFVESDGAIVFKGEIHNMHTRVFVNSQGLPTYETKDVGLILKKWQDYHFDKSIIITGNEIYEYMQVVLKAVEQFEPQLVKKTTHITHGLVKPTSGVKMSSRLGNIIRAEDVLDAVNEANKKANRVENLDVSLGAVKYAFLKQRLGADIIFDPAESVSLEGNSGPYLQYAFVRANSILQKSDGRQKKVDGSFQFDEHERSLVRKIGGFAEIVEAAADELLPSHICTYLYELAQSFNRFYETNRVIGDPRESVRLRLVEAYANTLKDGLGLLNISTPDKM
ncbi:TPA: arginine--tRNA ligase [Candidatus Saccharibacteria bacterium]|nr:MAG: arginine--tRNA ligase [Candidatus Saccharibacteria bacterium RIFCSPHIGHO2_12_FULL_47_17]HCM52217.1 arginine--tRNA ligase [Candidatus Saccharibacteria bacterium]